jgi:hypothetical protein
LPFDFAAGRSTARKANDFAGECRGQRKRPAGGGAGLFPISDQREEVLAAIPKGRWEEDTAFQVFPID